ncbi:MAG TPA: ATP-grasp domain-containing protein [Planctomycetes bacterium]|nr:ATP-grasp domain-containing protein [Planctomycetota bacterium]HIK83135.1 ATP-grasp domain-containing protein [Planctomycetota bacterium]
MTPSRVLVANRGECACRIIRTLSALGLETVAVHSEADRNARFVEAADHSREIGPASPSHSYLDIDRIIEAGREVGVHAVHPGWGFLSESPELARRVEQEGWTYIGPTAEQVLQLGDKTQARTLALASKVPCAPSLVPPGPESTEGPSWTRELKGWGSPLLIKATRGGGGKGMRIVRDLDQLEESIESAQREALAAFGDDSVFIEKLIEPARHIEVQLIGDGLGEVAILGDRECTLQRRHQKLIEESPAPSLPSRQRSDMHEAARRLAQSVHYRGAGTVEFLFDGEQFYFLEMNTRLQVEHPVTELVHGVDIVKLQWQVATGQAQLAQLDAISTDGHAIEVRINAEDPAAQFLPSIGTLTRCLWPQMDGVRIDSGVRQGDRISAHYDPMLAKIIAHGETREDATRRLVAAIEATLIAGVETTLPFCRDLLCSSDFAAGTAHTTLVEEKWGDWQAPQLEPIWLQAIGRAARQLLGSTAGDGAEVAGCWQRLPGRVWP